jgi:hypothetical protein
MDKFINIIARSVLIGGITRHNSQNETPETQPKELQMVWAIVETYYKRAEYQLIIIRSEVELRHYLIESMIEYEIEDDVDIPTPDLIELAQFHGNARVRSEMGWGIREIVRI